MPEYLVERYEPGILAERLREEARRLAEAVSAMHREGAQIEVLGQTFVPRDEGVLSRFESASEDLVIDALGRAAIPFERIVEALPLDVEGGASG